MTDHAKRQYDLEMQNIGGMSNKKAVLLMFLALVVPNLILMMIG